MGLSFIKQQQEKRKKKLFYSYIKKKSNQIQCSLLNRIDTLCESSVLSRTLALVVYSF